MGADKILPYIVLSLTTIKRLFDKRHCEEGAGTARLSVKLRAGGVTSDEATEDEMSEGVPRPPWRGQSLQLYVAVCLLLFPFKFFSKRSLVLSYRMTGLGVTCLFFSTAVILNSSIRRMIAGSVFACETCIFRGFIL